ncbi:MAG: NosD domain-containing protein [Candidatus Daviesbacteria bacterium]|nr:NosD domain-containing protein [Candidatus Daviesbacteria bacterium]
MFKEKYLPKIHWFLRFVIVIFCLALMWFFIAYIIPNILPVKNVSNTSKFGFVSRNEIWSGDIKIIGDIWALPGTTVTIAPGTRVLIADHGDRSNMHFFPADLRSGLNTKEESFGVRNGELFWDEGQKISLSFAKLYAIGTKQQPIIIKSDVLYPPSPYDFNLFSMGSGIFSNVRMSNYRRFQIGSDVSVRDSEFKNVAECSICVEYDTKPTIVNNLFENSLREYILIEGASPKISDNWFMASKGKGIVVDPKTIGTPLIYYNNFEMPGQIAIEFLGGAEDNGGAISFNNFAGASIIQIPCDSKVKLNQNLIKGVIKFSHSGNCVGDFIIGSNYWQTTDKKAILNEKIVDKEKGFNVLLPSILKNDSQVQVGKRN